MAQVESVRDGVPNGDRGGYPSASPSASAEPVTVTVPVGDKQHAPEGSGGVAEAGKEVANSRMVAPTLRVEELREDDGHSSSSYLSVSEEEGGLSQGEASDQDHGHPTKESAASKEFVPPEDELKEQIIKQVEFYFSDVNILKDAFLLKHVRRNKQGYVSLKLITSFRKVKKMTKDFRVVAYSLQQSEHLELNEEGSKVRRKVPLPDYDETTPSRTVVAVNLPNENPTVENVAELFAKCGDIALVRILKPGKPLPPDVKRHVNKHPELGNAVCAVIEFEHHDTAKKSCDILTNTDDWRKGLRVVLLAHQKKEKNAKQKADKNDKVVNNDVGPTHTPADTKNQDHAPEKDVVPVHQAQSEINHDKETDQDASLGKEDEHQTAATELQAPVAEDKESPREGHRKKKKVPTATLR